MRNVIDKVQALSDEINTKDDLLVFLNSFENDINSFNFYLLSQTLKEELKKDESKILLIYSPKTIFDAVCEICFLGSDGLLLNEEEIKVIESTIFDLYNKEGCTYRKQNLVEKIKKYTGEPYVFVNDYYKLIYEDLKTYEIESFENIRKLMFDKFLEYIKIYL